MVSTLVYVKNMKFDKYEKCIGLCNNWITKYPSENLRKYDCVTAVTALEYNFYLLQVCVCAACT